MLRRKKGCLRWVIINVTSKLYDESTISIIQEFLHSNDYYPDSGWSLPESLFSYTALYEYDDAGKTRDIVDDLDDGSFTVTSPALFNDIYDSTVHMNSLVALEKVMHSAEQTLEFPFYTGPYKEIIIDIANTNDQNRMTDLLRPLRIKCFSTQMCSVLQWGLYADKNSGICVEYNPQDWTSSEHCFFPIIYSSTPIDVSRFFDKSNANYNPAIGVIISSINKGLDWKHECEWRLIQNNYDCFDVLPQRVSLCHDFKPKSVTLGMEYIHISIDSDKGFIAEKLAKWLFKNKIDSYKVDYKKGSFELHRLPVLWNDLDYGFWLCL